MRTATIAATAITLALLTGATAAQAAPNTRPAGDFAAGRLIRQHDCRPGAVYAPTVKGFLLDMKATPRRDLKYVPIGNITQTWDFTVTHSCYR